MEKVRKIAEFIGHVDSSVESMMDELITTGYNSKYDLHLTMNGKTVTLELNADTYDRLEKLLTEEVKEFLELDQTHIERIKPLAQYQMLNPSVIAFQYLGGITIVNPFVNIHGTEEIDPFEYYGKFFLKSDWFNENKVSMLEEIRNAE